MSKHTQGPWAVNTYTNHFGWSIYADVDGCIAERWYSIELPEEQNERMKANAQLMSAAPELAEALLELIRFEEPLQMTGPTNTRWRNAQSALKKAGIE